MIFSFFIGAFVRIYVGKWTSFFMEDVNDGFMTQNCGVEVEFDQSSHVIHHDQNLIHGALGYVGKIQETIQVDFSLFQYVIFRCKWWDTFDQNNVKKNRDSGLISINSRKMWHEVREPYAFPKHYNQVVFKSKCVG